MKNTKRRIEWFAFYDRCGMERHLEKMAEQGWMLTRLTSFCWQYRRITPAKLHFAITYFAEVSIFDPVLPAGQQAYLSYCQKAGWHLAVNSAQFQAFYSEEEDPVPIETDAVTQVSNIHRVMMKSQVLAFILLLILSVFQLFGSLQMIFEEPEIELASNMTISVISLFSLAMFLCISQLLGYFLWYYRAKKAANLDGSFYDKPCGVWIAKLALFFLVVNMMFLIYSIAVSRLGIIGGMAFAVVPVVICLSLLIRNTLIHWGVPKGLNRLATFAAITILTFVFLGSVVFVGILTVDDHLFTTKEAEIKAPLLVSDLTAADRTKYEIHYDRDQSILLDRIEVEDRLKDRTDEEAPQLLYTLTKVKADSIYNICFDAILRKNQENWQGMSAKYVLEQDPSRWHAEKVYCLYRGVDSFHNYIVCWKDRIAEIQFYFDPTEKEIGDAARALKSY